MSSPTKRFALIVAALISAFIGFQLLWSSCIAPIIGPAASQEFSSGFHELFVRVAPGLGGAIALGLLVLLWWIALGSKRHK